MKKTISFKNVCIALLSLLFFLCAILSVLTFTKKEGVVMAEEAQENKVEVYQLAPNTGWLMQSYVIKTANGKLIVIDGGGDGAYGYVEQGGHGTATEVAAYLPTALRAIAGVGENGYFEIEAWFITHAHKDHFHELAKCLAEYNDSSNYKINNIYFDFPAFGTSEYPLSAADFGAPYGTRFKNGLDNYAQVNGIATSGSYYDDINGAVINAEAISKGLNINIDGVRFEILQTWDISDLSYYSNGGVNFNDTSLIMKMYVNDTTFLWLADAGEAAGARLVNTYSTEELTCDYVQMAHHGQTGCTLAQYEKMGVTPSANQVYLWPTPAFVWDNTTSYPNLTEVYNQANGTTTLAKNGNNVVACLYDAYPTALTSYTDWSNAIGAQKVVSLDYTEVDFEIVGAQARIEDPEALRFVAKMSDTMAAQYKNAKVGMIFVAQEEDTTQWLRVSSDGATCTTNANATVVSSTAWWEEDVETQYGIEDGYAAFSCAVLDGSDTDGTIPPSMYDQPITAVAFIIPENGEIIYTERVTRSLGYVAIVEQLQDDYQTNDVVEKIASEVADTISFSVNDGAMITSRNLITPQFTVAGMDAATSPVAEVRYTSDNEDVLKIVGNKVQAVESGVANLTATLSAGGEAVITKTVAVETEVGPEGSFFYARFEDGAIPETLTNTSGSEIAVTNENAVEGAKSLKVTTVGAGLTATWNKMLYLAGTGWTSTGKTYLISVKLKYTLPSEVSSGILILRMKDSSNWMEVAVTSNSATYKKGPARSNISYDAQTGILTMNAYLTPETNGQNIELTTVSTDGGAWTLYVDQITFYEAALDEEVAPAGSWRYDTLEAETYNNTYAAGGSTLALTKEQAISGTQSLLITTSTAGAGASWNNFFYFATTGWTQTVNDQGKAVSHAVSFKMRATLPEGKTSGIIIVRMQDDNNYKTNGLEMRITSSGATKVAGSEDSKVSYDALTGIISVEVYLTASYAGQNIQMATAGTSGGVWSVVLDNVAFFTITSYEAQIASSGVKYETLQQAFAAAKEGDTITLLKDINVTTTGSDGRIKCYAPGVNVTLDGNNKKITSVADCALAFFHDSSLDTDNGGTLKLTVKNLTVESNDTAGFGATVQVNASTVVTLDGCNLYSKQRNTNGSVIVQAGGTCIVQGGTEIAPTSGSAICCNGASNSVSVYDCTIEANYAFRCESTTSVVNVYNGANITHKVQMFETDKGGILNVMGGNITATATDKAVIVAPNANFTVNIYGGSFTGGNAIYQNAADSTKDIPYSADTTTETLMPVMSDGISTQLVMDNAGLVFQTNVPKNLVDYINQVKDADTAVRYGTIIVSKEYLDSVNCSFTAERLDAMAIGASKYKHFVAESVITNGDGSLSFTASLVNIRVRDYTLKYAATGYVEYTINGTTKRLYSVYNAETNAWDIFSVATAALADVAVESDSTYRYPVTSYLALQGATYVEVTGNAYSKYTDEERAILENYYYGLPNFTTSDSDLTEMTLGVVNNTETTFKTLGRTYERNGGLACDYTVTGIEFNAYCAGSIYVKINSSAVTYFTVYVDGVRQEDRIMAVAGLSWVEIAYDLSEGEHHIQLVKQGQYSMSTNEIQEVMIYGEFRDKPADKELFIEYYGDSITSGSNVYGGGTSVHTSDGTNAFAWLSAQQLGADCSLVSRGGLPLCSSSGALSIYDSNNGSASATGTAVYDFARIPDAVVVELGINDKVNAGITESEYKEGVRQFVANIRAKYGNDVAIIWLGGYSVDDYSSYAQAVIEELNAAGDDKIYLCTVSNCGNSDGNGGSDFYHPDVTKANIMASEVATYIQQVLGL